jgi:antitoxin (DNA-binding transcriptional repressor) of toxin-antitoxin stability system
MDAKSVPARENLILAEHAAEIRRLGKQTIENVVEIGRRLTECKKLVGHGNWLPWLDREFGWSHDTALNFMRVYEMAGSDSERVRNLNIPLRTLYLLAAPSTPEAAKTEILERAEAGESVSVTETKRVVERHKSRASRPRTRNMGRLDIIRRKKLGEDTVEKLKGTSLDSAAEMDELVFLNRGAPEGEHTEPVEQLVAAAVMGKNVSAIKYTESGGAFRREDIGADSQAEAERLRVYVEKLEADKCRLELKVAELESELEDLRGKLATAGGEMSISEFQAAIGKWEDTVETQRGIIAQLQGELASLRAGIATRPPPDDGLDIPECLRRSAP